MSPSELVAHNEQIRKEERERCASLADRFAAELRSEGENRSASEVECVAEWIRNGHPAERGQT